MAIKLIVAHDLNSVIGYNNLLPWYIPEDLAFFKEMTTGCCVIMGKNTFLSLGSKPLPNRNNIVVSSSLYRNGNYPVSCDNELGVLPNLSSAVVYASHFNKETGKDVWVIGGSQLYKEAIEKDILDEMYITTVKMEIDNSSCVYFPKEIIKWDKWKSTIIKETDLCTYTHWIKT